MANKATRTLKDILYHGIDYLDHNSWWLYRSGDGQSIGFCRRNEYNDPLSPSALIGQETVSILKTSNFVNIFKQFAVDSGRKSTLVNSIEVDDNAFNCTKLDWPTTPKKGDELGFSQDEPQWDRGTLTTISSSSVLTEVNFAQAMQELAVDSESITLDAPPF